MSTPIAATRRPVPADGAAPHPPTSPEQDRVRVERMVDAIRRLGDQLETTHRTLDEFVARLSDAARDAQAAGGQAPAAEVPSPRVARPAVGVPVRRPAPVAAAPAPGSQRVPPAGLAEHVRAPAGTPEGPVGT